MRILLFDRSDRGGIALYTDRLRDALRAAGHETWLCGPRDRAVEYPADPPPLAAHLWGPEADRHSPAALRLRRLGEIPVSAAAVARAVHRRRPDVVHAQTEILPRLDPMLWAAVRRRVPVVLTVHDPTPLFGDDGEDGEMERQARVWRAVDTVIVHDDRGRDLVQRRAPDTPVAVIPVDLALNAPGPGREEARRRLGLGAGPIALALGLLRDYKGFDLLADSWPAVVAAGPSARLYVVGDANELPVGLDRLLESPGVELRKGFIPADEFGLWAAAADVLVTPYRHGSHSGVLNQALTAGTPVLSSPALAEEVERTGAGRVVPRDPAAWTEALIDALWRDPMPCPAPPANELTVRETTAVYRAVTSGTARSGKAEAEPTPTPPPTPAPAPPDS
jgi:glycosyltransferase involved in cell wall biosynthesis